MQSHQWNTKENIKVVTVDWKIVYNFSPSTKIYDVKVAICFYKNMESKLYVTYKLYK